MTDVKAKTVTGTGALAVGASRTRIRAIYYVAGASAGSVSIKDGGASGTEILNIATPAGVTLTGSVDIPGNGILSSEDPYVTLTNITSVTVFYG